MHPRRLGQRYQLNITVYLPATGRGMPRLVGSVPVHGIPELSKKEVTGIEKRIIKEVKAAKRDRDYTDDKIASEIAALHDWLAEMAAAEIAQRRAQAVAAMAPSLEAGITALREGAPLTAKEAQTLYSRIDQLTQALRQVGYKRPAKGKRGQNK